MRKILVFVFHLLFLHDSFCFIPQIVDLINTAVVDEKGTAYLNCTMVIEDDQLHLATWNKGRGIISRGESIMRPVRKGPYGQDKYMVRFFSGRPGYAPDNKYYGKQLRTYQLIARFVDASDSQINDGEDTRFRCEIQIPSTTQKYWPKAYGKILVKRAPHILPGLTSRIVNEGDSLDLTCNSTDTPKPKMSWTRANGQPFNLENSPMRIEGAHLHIPKMSRHDRGVYRCYAVNNVYKSAEYDVLVEVNYRPYVRHARFKGSYGQAESQDLHVYLECIVNGYPDPDLYWYEVSESGKITELNDGGKHDLEKIRSYGAVGTNVTDVFSVLLVRNIRALDYGTYRCVAQNSYGSDSADVNLFYQSICQGPLCSMPSASVDNSKTSGD